MSSPDIYQSVSQIAQHGVSITKETSSETVAALIQSFSNLSNGLREAIQAMTAPQVEALIPRLNKNEAVTAADIDLMRLWIVGDAEAYVKEENNFDDWVTEAQRLIQQVGKTQSGSMDVTAMNELQGVARDGIKTLSNIENYLDSVERAHNFETSIKQLTKQSKQTLATILQAKLTSDRS